MKHAKITFRKQIEWKQLCMHPGAVLDVIKLMELGGWFACAQFECECESVK